MAVRQRNKIRLRDVQKGGKYYKAPDWYCDGCKETHSGFRRSTQGSDGKTYCDKELMKLYARTSQLVLEQAKKAN